MGERGRDHTEIHCFETMIIPEISKAARRRKKGEGGKKTEVIRF